MIGIKYDDTHYLYRRNLFGDITAIYDRDTCVAKYAYDAYGVCKVMNPDGTENTDDDFIGNVNPIRYRGYYYDVGTGFYYLQTRYYDPQIGRFLNMDGLEYLDPETVGGLNLYAYCNCNPVMYVDPEGTLFGFIFWGMLIGALVVGTIGAICEGTEAYNNGARGWDVVEAAAEGFFEGAKAGAAIGSTIATIIYAAPAIAAFLSTTFTFGGMALITGGTTVMVTVTGAELVAIGAVAIAGIGLVLSKLPMNGGPANGTLTNGTSTGYYDGNGNLIERTDFSGKSHYIKEEGKYCLPHTHHYRWDYIKDAWRIIKRWITK